MANDFALDFALGVLRSGCKMARPEINTRMAEAQPPWNVNSLAQLAGKACMKEFAWREESLAILRRDTEILHQGLVELGWPPRETTTNYVLVPVRDATALRHVLLQRKIVVRDCTSFGLPRHIRVATQRPHHNLLLLEAMEELAQDHADTS
jgi:histidinol-phosphate aminotransferase